MEAFRLINLTIISYLETSLWWVLLLQAILLWVVYFALKSLYQLTIIRLTGRHHKPKSYLRLGERKILLVGDSTAVGTGSIHIDRTLGGYLANDFPKTDIINKSVNGSLTGHVLDQLLTVATEKFDLILISTGGNDVWAFTNGKKIRAQLIASLDLAKKMSNHKVVLIFFGNEGSAPFFPLLLSGLLLNRTDYIRQIFTGVATLQQVPLIELFSKPKENPFIIDPKRFFAPDGLHPNERGYWEWYKHLWRLMVRGHYLFHEDISLKSQRQTDE